MPIGIFPISVLARSWIVGTRNERLHVQAVFGRNMADDIVLGSWGFWATSPPSVFHMT